MSDSDLQAVNDAVATYATAKTAYTNRLAALVDKINKGNAVTKSDWADLVTNYYDPVTAASNDFRTKLMAIKFPTKEEISVLDYELDWSDWLGADTIATSTWTIPTGITKDTDTHTTTTTTVWLSGGTDGVKYQLRNAIVTAGGRSAKRTASITIKGATPTDTTAPTITSSSTRTISEGSQLSHALTANETVTWAITGGADSAQFALSGSTLEWTGNGTGPSPDATTAYHVQVTATDTAGNATNQSITVTVSVASGGVSEWRPLKIGGGGWCTGIDIHSDGTKVIRTDTGGAYIWDSVNSVWSQLCNRTSMPTITVADAVGQSGAFEIKIAPSNSSIFYMAFIGYVWVSTNKGASWTKTNLAYNSGFPPNNGYRGYGQKLAIDPANSNIVYVGSVTDGVHVTTDGGSTWSLVSTASIPISSQNYCICFDPSQGTLSSPTRTKRIYIGSSGNNLYHSEDGGATWAAVSGAPTTTTYAVVGWGSTSGYLFTCDASQAWRYIPGTGWTGSGSNSWVSIAVDQVTSTKIRAIRGSGHVQTSTNSGGTWDGGNFSRPNAVSTDVPWLQLPEGGGPTAYMTVGGFQADPSVGNKVWISHGLGVSYSDLSDYIYYDQSAGIEQLVTQTVIAPLGASVNVSVQDRGTFRLPTPDSYPSSYGPVNNTFTAGWTMDFASNDPTFLIILSSFYLGGAGQSSSYSSDGGANWTQWPTFPQSTYDGGCIAAASSTNWVVVCGQTGVVYNTKNGGSTWATSKTISTRNAYTRAYDVCADRVNIGTFYLYDASAVYKSTNNGDTWSSVMTGTDLTNNSGVSQERMRSVPKFGSTSTAGHLFFCAGNQYWRTQPYAGSYFWASVDGGATWAHVPNFLSVFSFNFGACPPGKNYPSIVAAGWYNGTWGIYRCDDWNPSNFATGTWTAIGDGYPLGLLSQITDIAVDPVTYTKVYVGIDSNGFAYYD